LSFSLKSLKELSDVMAPLCSFDEKIPETL
jgi:hypothetical protein